MVLNLIAALNSAHLMWLLSALLQYIHDFVFGVQLTKDDPMDDYNLVEFNHISWLKIQNSLIFSGLYLTKPVTVLTTKLFLDQRQNLAKKGITASAV